MTLQQFAYLASFVAVHYLQPRLATWLGAEVVLWPVSRGVMCSARTLATDGKRKNALRRVVRVGI